VKLEQVALPPPRRLDRNAWAMAGVLATLWAVLALLPATRAAFLSQRGLATLLSQNAHILVVAVGMTLVILIRGIDLSVGSGVALTGCVAALLQIELGVPAPFAIAAALGAGAVIGLWNGVWISRFGIPAFVVTLAGLNCFRGLGLVLSHARGLSPMHEDFSIVTRTVPPAITWLLVLGALAIGIGLTVRDAARRRAVGLAPPAATTLATLVAGQAIVAGFVLAVFGARGIPAEVLIAALVVLGGIFLTRRTRFGRHVYAIGGNPEAARLSGIDVKRVTLIVYVIVGVLTALAGVLLAAALVDVLLKGRRS
jgi:D-xylose transport system permease protein